MIKKTAHDLLDDMRFSTVRLTVENNEGEESFGTGFFFNPDLGEENLLLITNRHVIADWKSITFRANKAGENGIKPILGNIQKVRIDNTLDQIVLEHPEEDLVAIMIWPQLRRLLTKGVKLGIRFFVPKHIPSEWDLREVSPVEEILMTGYPDGLSDEKNNLPIVRRGITATDYKVDYNGRKEFLIDAPIFQGNSGSIVMIFDLSGGHMNVEGRWMPGVRFLLLGVLTDMKMADYQQNVYVKNEDGDFELDPDVMTENTSNLGHCVKAECLLWFRDEIKRRVTA